MTDYHRYNGRSRAFVSKYFKVSGAIVEMGEIKGGKAKTCYINLGTSTGVSKGTKCEVYEVKTIAGREAKVLIGTLTVEEVVADDLSSCKFVSGAPEILKAFQDGHPLTIVTKEKVTLTGIANAVGGIL